MTRSKKTPTVHKPPFDEENTLRFAAMEQTPPAGSPLTGEGGGSHRAMSEKETGITPQPDREPLTLLLKADTIITLQNEARRKGKAVDQIIDKLVAKHLGKH